jgi:hypothetical protein
MLLLTSVTILLLLSGVADAILLLQLPGVNLNYPSTAAIEIEFLDLFDNVQYSVKGDFSVPGYTTEPQSNFYPPKLLQRPLAIKSMRIKAGESGMTLKIYGSAQSTTPSEVLVPALSSNMITGFFSQTEPLSVPFSNDQQIINFPAMTVTFLNPSQSGINAAGGFYIQRIEIDLQRAPLQQKQAVPVYLPYGEVYGGSQSNSLAAAINNNNNGPSVQPKNSVLLGTGPQAQPMIIQQPASPNQTPPLNQFIQAPNTF